MKAKERELLTWFRQLDHGQQNSLLSYAEFLCSKPNSTREPAALATPLDISPAARESVVAALKRLSKSYFMLESTDLLNRASALMAQHIMQGREALDVIIELEEMFSADYEKYRQAYLVKTDTRKE